MKLHQLRYLCEVIDSGMSVSRAAARLHTSPSGISKQLKVLEEELGVQLLTRKRTRITGVTRTADAALPVMRRIIQDIDHVRRISDESSGQAKGYLRVGTTHTHARYSLVPAITQFVQSHPQVRLHLLQGAPAEISSWVLSGSVDIGVGSAAADADPALVQRPWSDITHSLVVPKGHPLERVKQLTLQAIARYPLITNDSSARLGRLVEEAFASKGVTCNIAIRAMDTSVIKKFVELGFGIAVLPSMTVDKREDGALRSIQVDRLFPPTKACVITLRDKRLPHYGRVFLKFIEDGREAKTAIGRS